MPSTNHSAPAPAAPKATVGTPSLGDRLVRWALTEPTIKVLVQIGSQVRCNGSAGADQFSDWDFQVVSSKPSDLDDRSLFERAEIGRPYAFVSRSGRLGSATKVTALFDDGELDLVVVPFEQMMAVNEAVRAGRFRESPPIMKALVDLSAVLAGGYRILKGQELVEGLLTTVAKTVEPARLSDDKVRELGEEFVCDFVSTSRKIARGELIAAQRWLHHQLAEVNFRLLHELRNRGRVPTFPDSRRIEFLLNDHWRSAVSVEASLGKESLEAALAKSSKTFRELMQALVGETWRWPVRQAG